MIRIVKLTIKEECIELFHHFFVQHHEIIKKSNGCIDVNLLQSIHSKHIFFTYSNWNSADDLENYRSSDTFKNIWAKVKPMFAEKAEAWSLERID
jgi:hypothetical protein